MDVYILSFLVIGLLLLTLTLGSGLIARLPLSYALIYLVLGMILGPYGVNIIQLKPEAELMQRLTEFVVIVSLYSCGLKMNRPLKLWIWGSTVRLIIFLMPFSIFAVALIGYWGLGLSWGAAVLLGAILAPTDPVLASEVQLADPDDRNELRFGLTSEGGLNDALAFPFVYFGLYWLKDNQWQHWVIQWVAVDLIWAIAAGIGMGFAVAKGIIWLSDRVQKIYSVEVERTEDFLTFATILLAYSVTEAFNGYGFLAVFVAGLTIRQKCVDQEMPVSQLEFVERIEKLLEIGTILLVGSILQFESIGSLAGAILLVTGALLLVIRPAGAWLSTISFGSQKYYYPPTRWLFGWFGIRGVGSLYYLSYAYGHGLSPDIASQLGWITYSAIAISVVLHGITTTPLMRWYERALVQYQSEAKL
jgi:sodium/hydrogen antiporter